MFGGAFRSRRRHLADRLTSRRRRPKVEEDDDGDDGGVRRLLDQLQRNQLEMLLAAVDSRGSNLGGCVLVPRGGDRLRGEQPHVVCCREWRWTDLGDGDELRRLPTCPSACDPVYVCCNPYHWSRLCQPDTPPPPYSRTNSDRIRPEDRAPSEAPLLARDTCGSLTTNGESATHNPLEWCRLAYWEQERRVGPLYPVESPAVNVFGNVPYGHDGLCLETLARSHSSTGNEAVNKTRAKIGRGVTVSREERGRVWVYNRSDHPVFVNSVDLDENPDSPQPTRVPPEHCVCVRDPEREARERWNPPKHFGPVDQNSVRISFVKGWGQNYSRREITSCPCWVEILLAPCR